MRGDERIHQSVGATVVLRRFVRSEILDAHAYFDHAIEALL